MGLLFLLFYFLIDSRPVKIHGFLERLLYRAAELFLLRASLLFKVAVSLVGKLEELLDPEEAYSDENDPVVKRVESVKRNDRHTEDDGSRADSSAYHDGGDEPGELHLGGACDHNERIVGEYREKHHKREVGGSSCTQKLKRSLTVLLAEQLFTDPVAAGFTDYVEYRT